MNITIDTNILIRLLSNDIPQKAKLVEDLLKKEENLFIPDVVFPELEYILINEYRFSRGKLAEIYKSLSSLPNVKVTTAVKNAIRIFGKSKLDMADCIIAAYSYKGKLASFDKELLEIDEISPFWK